MNDGDRGSPVTLTRDEPVAQTEVLRCLTSATFRKNLDCFSNRILLGEAIELARVDELSFATGGNSGHGRVVIDDVAVFVCSCRNIHDDLDGQVICASKVKVALVVGRNRHHSTMTVVSQNVVCSPDRKAFAIDRVDGVTPQEDTGLGAIGCLALNFRRLLNLGEVVSKGSLNLRSCTSSQLRS